MNSLARVSIRWNTSKLQGKRFFFFIRSLHSTRMCRRWTIFNSRIRFVRNEFFFYDDLSEIFRAQHTTWHGWELRLPPLSLTKNENSEFSFYFIFLGPPTPNILCVAFWNLHRLCNAKHTTCIWLGCALRWTWNKFKLVFKFRPFDTCMNWPESGHQNWSH